MHCLIKDILEHARQRPAGSLSILLKSINFARPKHVVAQVAELVDALVSNTSDSNIVPVRSRPWAQSITGCLKKQNK
jgi:hypothetical protein